MTSVAHFNRFGRVQIFAALLLCGGICAVSLPWLLSAFEEPQEPSPIVHPQATRTKLEPLVPLPTENLQGKAALEYDLRLLREGLRLLEQTPDYSGTFRKQERVDGVLDAGALIQVKGRHQPLSLYLKWLEGDTGRELLFVEGERDGDMLVRLGGLRGRLLPAIKLDPDGELARQKVRHHISRVSIRNLTRQVIEHCEEDLKRDSGVQCELIANFTREDRAFIRVSMEYANPKVGGEYRKAIHFIDRETLLPVVIKTHGWLETGQTLSAETFDEETLLEHYEYSNLQFGHHFTDADFSDDNPQYNFRRAR